MDMDKIQQNTVQIILLEKVSKYVKISIPLCQAAFHYQGMQLNQLLWRTMFEKLNILSMLHLSKWFSFQVCQNLKDKVNILKINNVGVKFMLLLFFGS